jgi:hypothetical protein
MIQIEQFGYLSEKYVRMPSSAQRDLPSPFPCDCRPKCYWLTPVMVPGVALSFLPNACGGLSRYHLSPLDRTSHGDLLDRQYRQASIRAD